ncbi:unnamed protein product [Caenorhabditis brenneri]
MEDADQPHAAGNEPSELEIRLQQSTNALLQSKIAAINAQAAIEEAKIEAAAKELKFLEKERRLVERNQGIRLGMLEAEGALYEEKKKRAEEELGRLRTAAPRGRGRAHALQPTTSTAAVTQAPEVQTPEAQAPEPSVRLTRKLTDVDYSEAKRRKDTEE